MTDILETRINDTVYSATSCSWLINALRFEGITAFDFSEKRERKLVHAGRRNGTPLGMTMGKYSVDALSMTMLTSSFQRLIESLTLTGFGSYGDAKFPIIVTYSEPFATVAGVRPIVIAIQGCRITGAKDTHAEGIDEKVTQVDMMAMSLTRNGLQLWSALNGIGG